ncbi:MAG: hypothetical protein ACRYGP_32915 [Janthinobacterium lividum]
MRREILERVQAVAVSADERPTGILRKIDRTDAALLVEAFPDTLNVIGQEIHGAMLRGSKPDFEATRCAVEMVFHASEARKAAAGIHPRLGGYRRDVVLEAQRRGLDLGSHRVAAVSFVHDCQDLRRAGFFPALRFLSRYHTETVLLKLRFIGERTWPPRLH